MNVAAVILAGGASRRMGSPKALLTYRGQTFADRLIDTFAPYCSPVIVVLGYNAERLRAGIVQSATLVYNPDHALGQLTSLQCGLRNAGSVDAAFFTPVDYPLFDASTVAMLMDAWTGESAAVVPSIEGKHGHPVLIGRRMIDDILALPSTASARDVIHAYAPQTRYIAVQDAGVLRDIDYPADYAALEQVSV